MNLIVLQFSHTYLLVPAAEIRDRETGLVSGPFSWFQSRQIFHETHETEANPIIAILPTFLGSRLHFCIEKQTNQSGNSINLLILRCFLIKGDWDQLTFIRVDNHLLILRYVITTTLVLPH